MFKGLRRWCRNRRRNAWGYGKCKKCGGAWNWKKSVDICNSYGQGWFLLCRECFEEMTVDEIKEIYKKNQNWGENKGYTKLLEENIERQKSGKQQRWFYDQVMEDG